MTEELYTLAQISRIIDVPESTVRYYRNTFSSYFKPIGKGKRKRYGQDAINTLRFISYHLRDGCSIAEVAELLKKQFQQVIEVTATKATITQVEQVEENKKENGFLLADISVSKAIIQQLSTTLTVLSDYKHEVEGLRNQLWQLQQERDEQKERELSEARGLIEQARDHIRTLEEEKAGIEKEAREKDYRRELAIVAKDKEIALIAQKLAESQRQQRDLKEEMARIRRPWFLRLLRLR